MPAPAPPFQSVIELRRYLLHPGQRNVLIDLFERALIEPQEACGMSVLGQFRDLDRPDDFVWMRGFSDMEARGKALAAFYDGPVWAEHRDAANATMKRFDDVLLLRPAEGGFGFALDGKARPASSESAAAMFAVFIFPLARHRADAFPDYFARTLLPLLTDAGAPAGARLVTEERPTTFPRLPVRENERVFAWMARFDDARAHGAFASQLAATAAWRDVLGTAFSGHMAGPAMCFRLSPTGRSLLR